MWPQCAHILDLIKIGPGVCAAEHVTNDRQTSLPKSLTFGFRRPENEHFR